MKQQCSNIISQTQKYMKNLYSYFRLLASPNFIKNLMEKNASAQSLRVTIYKKLCFSCLGSFPNATQSQMPEADGKNYT